MSKNGVKKRCVSTKERNSTKEPEPSARERGNNHIFRLNKYLAHCGICSRRKADQLIKTGLISVNQQTTTHPGTSIYPNDKVYYQSKLLTLPKTTTGYLFNKPPNLICSHQKQGRTSTIFDYLKPHIKNIKKYRFVGRLDKESEGLIILISNGQLIQKLSHPKFETPKKYLIAYTGTLSTNKLLQGITDQGQHLSCDQIETLKQSEISSQTFFNQTKVPTQFIKVTIHEGKKRHLRRLFKKLNLQIHHLKRIQLGPLKIDDLPSGQFRQLTNQEINKLNNLERL